MHKNTEVESRFLYVLPHENNRRVQSVGNLESALHVLLSDPTITNNPCISTVSTTSLSSWCVKETLPVHLQTWLQSTSVFSRDARRTNDRSSTQRITSVRKLCRKVPVDKILLINTYYKKKHVLWKLSLCMLKGTVLQHVKTILQFFYTLACIKERYPKAPEFGAPIPLKNNQTTKNKAQQWHLV